MEYEKLNLQGKAEYHFNRFKTDFDKWDCSLETRKENSKHNRLLLLKLKYLPENERIADFYSKLCDVYSNRFEH